MTAEDLGDGLVNVSLGGDVLGASLAAVNTHPRGRAVCVVDIVGLDVVRRELLVLG